MGTGWLIDPVTVVTSGHCLFMKDEGGWANSVRVYPGRNGPKSPEAYFAKTLMSVQGWVRESAPECDYGAIRLDCPVVNVGTLGFRTAKDAALARYNCHVVGYPADKQGEMWGQIRRMKNVSDETLFYDRDAWGSMSGAPVFVVENGIVLCIGINNSGDLGGSSATRITDRVFKNLESWKDSEK